jgi:hypothetical protein
MSLGGEHMRIQTRIALGTIIGTMAGMALARAVRWRRTWGMDPDERDRPLAGDDLVPTPTAIETRGITIDAPPEAVWPWLVQMGFGRAGWYSYDALDMRGKSADRIVPEWQTLEVGDIVPNSPTGGFAVKAVDRGKALVLYSDTDLVASQETAAEQAAPTKVPAGLATSGAVLRGTPTDFAASWAFVIEPLDGGRSRLIERFRVRFGEAGPSFRVVGPLVGAGVFVMLQRQMLGIRDRAQRTVVAPPAADRAKVPPTKRNGHATTETHGTEVLAGVAT